MATSTGLLTVEQFAALPRTDTRDELVDGEIISMPPPDLLQNITQKRLVKILDRIAGDGFVNAEVPFQPTPARNLVRIADVGWVSRVRLQESGLRGYLRAAPELVIEVLSPSNTSSEMNRRKREAFDGNCLEFWIVDIDVETVEVSTPDGLSRTYNRGQQFAAGPLGGATISVEAIFTD